VMVGEAGHMVLTERPDEVVTAIEKHLGDC
jgi:hypothetical protein